MRWWGWKEEGGESQGPERNLCVARTRGDILMGHSRKRMSGDTEGESRSSTLSLPPRATFRETSHQLQPYLQAFRLATLLFVVRKKALTLPHYHLYAAIWWKVHNKNETNYCNLFLVRFCWFVSSDTEKYILCTFIMPFDICFIQIFSWLLLARF